MKWYKETREFIMRLALPLMEFVGVMTIWQCLLWLAHLFLTTLVSVHSWNVWFLHKAALDFHSVLYWYFYFFQHNWQHTDLSSAKSFLDIRNIKNVINRIYSLLFCTIQDTIRRFFLLSYKSQEQFFLIINDWIWYIIFFFSPSKPYLIYSKAEKKYLNLR